MNALRTAATSLVVICVAGVTTSCSPSDGDVAVVEIDPTHLPATMLKGTSFKMSGLENGVGPESTAQGLRSAGWNVKITPERIKEMFRVSAIGRNGNTINAVFPTSASAKRLTASMSSTVNFEGYPSTAVGELSATYVGDNIVDASIDVQYGAQEKIGPLWSTIAASIAKDLGRSSFDGFPNELSGRNDFYLNGISITTEECFNPRSRATLTESRSPEDMLYDNRVCRLTINYSLWYGDDGSKKQSEIRGKIHDVLKAEYLRKFGEPDCWDWDDTKHKCELKSSREIYEALNAKGNALDKI